MALLTGSRVALALALTMTLGTGCSLILDPDDLTAEQLDGGAEDSDAGADTALGDTLVDDTSDDTQVAEDTATDSHTVDDTEVADTADTTDTTLPDTTVVDTALSDTVEPDDTVEPVDTTVDTVEPVHVVIAHSGAGGCELDYKTQFLDLTACPRTCPEVGGWTLVFDATQSTGVTSFDWDFEVTNQYKVTPESASSGRVEVNLDVPSCDLFSGSSLGSASIYATLYVNGDTVTEYSAKLDFSVRYLSSTCGATQGDCPDPP